MNLAACLAKKFSAVTALLVVFSLVACGGRTPGSIIPHASVAANPRVQTQPTITQANIFAAAQGLDLSDAQIDKYIDASVTGPDRALAHLLMRAMPKNLRGDFIAIDAGGRLISNNPQILRYAKLSSGPIASVKSSAAQKSSKRPLEKTMDGYVSNCAPPPSSGGADVRDVSACGMTDGWGFVYLPCGTTYFAPGDDGFLYMEITGTGGAINGNTIEGGYQINPPAGGGPGDGTIQPYTRALYLNNDQYLQMNYSNPGYTFGCDQTLTITHGISAAANNYIYTMVGQLPSSIDPQTQYVNMNSQFFYPDNYVWLWTQPATDMSGTGTDEAGYQSPCILCSVAKVTALAQTGGYNQDGSYFGVLNGQQDAINWLEVIFGQYSSNCTGQTGGTCQIESSSDPTIYYAGTQNNPDGVTAQSVQGPTGWGPYESYDGIAVGGVGIGIAQRTADGSFTEPLPPPPCSADSYGLCAINTSQYGMTSCSVYTYDVHSGTWYWKAINYYSKLVYATYRSSTLLGIATKTITKASSGCAVTSTTWSPGEPRTTYNDPNLP